MLFVANIQLRAEDPKPEFTLLRGAITKIHGNTLTVGEKTVTTDDKTEVDPGGKDALKVGANITARIKDGVAVRIEVHQPK